MGPWVLEVGEISVTSTSGMDVHVVDGMVGVTTVEDVGRTGFISTCMTSVGVDTCPFFMIPTSNNGSLM